MRIICGVYIPVLLAEYAIADIAHTILPELRSFRREEVGRVGLFEFVPAGLSVIVFARGDGGVTSNGGAEVLILTDLRSEEKTNVISKKAAYKIQRT